jgi:hypothetical protein
MNPRYAVGETYSFPLDLPGQVGRVVIDCIEPCGPALVCHVTLYGIQLAMYGMLMDSVRHFPIMEDNLAESMLTFVGTSTVDPKWKMGYDSWKENGGGVFAANLQNTLRIIRASSK